MIWKWNQPFLLGDVYEKKIGSLYRKKGHCAKGSIRKRENNSTKKRIQIVRHWLWPCWMLMWKVFSQSHKMPSMRVLLFWHCVFLTNKLLCKFDNVKFSTVARPNNKLIRYEFENKWIQLEIKIKTLSFKPFGTASYSPMWTIGWLRLIVLRISNKLENNGTAYPIQDWVEFAMLKNLKYSNNFPILGHISKPHNNTQQLKKKEEKRNNKSQTLFFSINNPLSSSDLRNVI